MWIVLWDPFLMKKLWKVKFMGSCEQCTRPTCVAKMCTVHWRKVNNCSQKKKKKKNEKNAKRERANRESKLHRVLIKICSYFKTKDKRGE